MCEPYMSNYRFPYVSFDLREYKEKHGCYPHPLGLGVVKEEDDEDKTK
jgi:hypothetical protein